MLITAYTLEDRPLNLLVNEEMRVGPICRLLAQLNNNSKSQELSLVEQIPDLQMERILEDDDTLVENILLWRPNSNNKLLFVEREDKYDLFINPERYLLSSASSERGYQLDEKGKKSLLEEFFSPSSGSFIGLPQIEGNLYVKTDGKKVWKKHYCILRASGLYYCPKGVRSKSPKDLVCLTKFDVNTVFNGYSWRKKYKAPNDWGFAIKPPYIQNKSSKYIKYFCAESMDDCKLWIQGIRIVKYGRQLKNNYEILTRELEEEEDSLANARSISVAEFPKNFDGSSPTFGDDVSLTSNITTGPGSTVTSVGGCSAGGCSSVSSSSSGSTNSSNDSSFGDGSTCWNEQLSRKDSLCSLSTSSSSGFMSNPSTPTMSEDNVAQNGGIAFEADCPIGTIKRKPCLQAKIPLTSTTRSLAKQSEAALLDIESASSGDDEKTLRNGTLRLRRSATDERLKNNIPFEGKSIGRLNSINTPCKPPEPFELKQQQPGHQISQVKQQPPSPPKSNNQSMLPKETGEEADCVKDGENGCDDDEYPLPPPPETLTASLSCLSLDSLPPPPSEFLDVDGESRVDSATSSAPNQQQQQPIPMQQLQQQLQASSSPYQTQSSDNIYEEPTNLYNDPQPHFHHPPHRHNNHLSPNHNSTSTWQRINELYECNNHSLSSPSSTSSSSSSSSSYSSSTLPSTLQFNNNNLINSYHHQNHFMHNGTMVKPYNNHGSMTTPTILEEQNIPFPPPPPVLRCTNSFLFDRTTMKRAKNPPPPPRRSDNTRLSGRYQLRH